MFDELDEALRALLIRELPVKGSEIDIAFNMPKREWSARLSKPTLNLYLYAVHENTKLRKSSWQFQVEQLEKGKKQMRRDPVWIDVVYLLTVWATEPEDEHRLLGRAMRALSRSLMLPNEVLPESLRAQPNGILLQAGQADTIEKPHDVWGVLDNELRPILALVCTMQLDPYVMDAAPTVQSRELRVGPAQMAAAGEGALVDGASKPSFAMRGRLQVGDDKPLGAVRVTLREHGEQAEITADHEFMFGNLAAGSYTLLIEHAGKTSSHPITVPSASYDIKL